MNTRVAINGFGRMGRLALRAAWDWPDFDIVHINETAGDAAAAAHLLKFDSVHGTWAPDVRPDEESLTIDGTRVAYSSCAAREMESSFAMNIVIWPYIDHIPLPSHARTSVSTQSN